MINEFEQTASPEGAHVTAELRDVTKRYHNGTLALDGLSLQVRAGEVLALLGPNGAGKSTAIKLLMGLTTPSQGHVDIFGLDPRHPAHRLRTGVMLQVGRAPETLRVREHLDLFRGYYPRPLPAAELVRVAGLQGIENQFFGELSGGQKQRVLFALALAGDPDLIFLDEPTVGLDIEARRILWAEIRTLAERGKSILLTTHYLEEADALATRIAVINKGRLICEGTPTEVKTHAASVASLRLSGELGPHELPAIARAPGQVDGTAAQAVLKLICCRTSLAEAHLRNMPGVLSVDQPPREMDSTKPLPTTVRTTQPEATLREMLALDTSLAGLEVVTPALEDAFLTLTQGEHNLATSRTV